MSIRYRPEIDGLRAVAVGSVLIYHLDLYVAGQKILQGGFLGVDIFFVISGFLIASLIRKEYVETGRFSLLDFYERRARRLLPALFVVIAAAYIAAPAILVPTSMEKFAESVLASVGFVSNIYWLFKSQVYGAHSGLVEPMLHTWSLAVEEQFYIVFPLVYIFVLCRVQRGLAWIGLGAIAAGLVLAEVLTRTDFSFSFYMLFSRIWELLCGAVLAHALAVRPDLGRGLAFARAMPGLGLALIVGSLFVVPLNWNHPGLGTVGAVLGTVLIIWFADPKEIVTRFLTWRVMLGIGLISYSLYLWHYPIYAFGRLLRLMDPGPVDYLIWLVLTFAAATITYFVVERPFRDRTAMPRLRLAGSLGVTALAIAVLSSFVLTRQGLPERFAWLTPYYGIIDPDNQFLKTQSWDLLEALAADAYLERSEAHEPSTFEKDHLWFDLAEPSHKVLIVGNSHSKDLFNALYLERARFPEFQFARLGLHNMIWPEQVFPLQRDVDFDAAEPDRASDGGGKTGDPDVEHHRIRGLRRLYAG